MAKITFLVIFCFLVQCFCVQLRLFKDDVRMPNVSIVQHVRSMTECAARFVNNKNSRTFNFHKDSNICELSAQCPEEGSEQSFGWKLYSAIECNYYISQMTATWNGAKTACESMSARLVIIDDESEQILLESIIGGDAEHWIGLQCSGTATPNCTWIDGRPMDNGYTVSCNYSLQEIHNWYPEEPHQNNCVWMGYGGYMWDDYDCYVQKYFICELFLRSLP